MNKMFYIISYFLIRILNHLFKIQIAYSRNGVWDLRREKGIVILSYKQTTQKNVVPGYSFSMEGHAFYLLIWLLCL